MKRRVVMVTKHRQMSNKTAGRILARLEEEAMSIVEKLKGLNLDRMEFDEAVELYAHATLIEGAYKNFETEQPEWLVEALGALQKDIRDRRRDAIAHELKLTDAALNGLKTVTEKKAELLAKQERLKAQLG